MGRILEYTSLGAAPADDDLLFLGDYSANASNPTTKRLLISDLNKKRNVDAADGNGLKLRDDAQNIGLFIKDGGASGPVYVGVNTDSPSYNLDLKVTGLDATLRIEAGTANDAIIRFDQTSTQRASIGYDDTGDLLKFNNSSNFSSNNHLVIDTNGNVGVGLIDPDYKLEVNGNIKAQVGNPGVVLIANKREIKGVDGTSDNELHLNRHSGGKIWFMRYTDSGEGTSNPVMYLDNGSGRSVQIGNVATGSAGEAKLWIVESDASKPVVRAENYVAGGSNVAGINIRRRDSGAPTNFYLNVGNDGYFNIGSSLANAGSSSLNINTSGNLSIGSTSFTYKFNALSSSNIVGRFLSSNTAGSRLLVESNGEAAATASNVVAFPITVSSTRRTNWMCGSLRNSETNYFGIYHETNDLVTESNVAFDSTLANNHFYINTDGDSYIKRNCRADGYFHNSDTAQSASDPGAGNYCRGRFLQIFHVPIYAHNDGYVFPALGGVNAGQTNGYQNPNDDQTPTADFASRAPYDGRLTKIDVSAFLPVGQFNANITPKFYFYSGSTLPSADGDAGMGTTNSSNVSLGTQTKDTSFSVTKGYSEFADATVGGGTNTLNFSAGDYLSIVLDPETTSGYFYANVAMTFEFLITD